MKILLITFFILFSGTFLFAQSTTDYIFRIKVAASKTPVAQTSKLYKDFPDLKAIEFPDGYIRYFTGEFETYHRAKEGLPVVQGKGYKDAYVVCIHDGKLLSGDEAIMKIYGEGE